MSNRLLLGVGPSPDTGGGGGFIGDNLLLEDGYNFLLEDGDHLYLENEAFDPVYDSDAQAYMTAVENADGQELESGVKEAINTFVLGCKSDGIWDAIKASCILAGARTLSGAIQPLVGTAPTNYNFVGGDYNRKTGLVGDGATKYLDSNRASNDDPEDDLHFSVYVSDAGTITTNRSHIATRYTIGAADFNGIQAVNDGRLVIWNRNGDALSPPNLFASPAGNSLGLLATTRSVSNAFDMRFGGNNYTATGLTATSYAPSAVNYLCFARNAVPVSFFSDSRLSFYSIGEALDLALLDSRVSTLISQIGAAIP